MKQRRRIAFLFSILLPLLFSASTVFGQWVPVYTCRSGGVGVARAAVSGFFFNEFVGFVGSSGDAGIFQTTDGGASWLRDTIPAGYSAAAFVSSIYFANRLRGWATIEDVGTKHTILKTTDGGLNWVVVGPAGSYNNIYETSSAVIAVSRNESSTPLHYPTIYSTDGGASFQSTGLTVKNGIDFVDDKNGVITSFTDANTTQWEKTVDGGITWTPITPAVNTESWSIYGVKGSSIYYAAPEDDPKNWPIYPPAPVSKILRSSDFGSTWTTVTTLPFLTTGHIAGFGEMLYVQKDNEGHPGATGLFRSTDKGVTWVPIQGPGVNRADTRFIVTGCNGGVVYAFDGAGVIWKTRNGGDGQISEPPVSLKITGNPIVFSGPICSTSYAALDLENLYCSEDTILSAELLDTSSSIISSGALTISAMPSFPLLLPSDAKDSIRFTWQPSKLFHSDTTVSIQVKVKYFSKILGLTFDTIVTVSVHAIGDTPDAAITPSPLDFGSISYCQPHDTSFLIQNLGCDTLFVESINPGAPAEYTIFDSLGKIFQLPIILPPLTRTKVFIRLNLTAGGSYTSVITLKLRHQGKERDTTLAIKADGFGIAGKYTSTLPVDTLFNLSLTRCDTARSFTFTVSNPSCVDKVTIKSATLEGKLTPDISLFQSQGLPFDLVSEDTLNLKVTVVPKILGSYSGKLHIIYQLGGVTHDTSMLYFLAVGYGSRILSVDRDTIDLGIMKLCDSRDSLINVKDLGCDSLQISNIQIQGSGNFALTGSSPGMLASNASAKIPFHFDPIGAGLISGTLTVTAIGDAPNVKTVYLFAHVIPTDTMTFTMVPTRTLFYPGDTLSVQLIPQQNVHNKGLQNLAFTINYNSDLLGLLPDKVGISSPFNYIAGTSFGTPKHTSRRIFLNGSPTLEMDSLKPVMTFLFSAYVTDSISTRFDLTDISMNGGDSVYARCSLGILSASLSYQLALACGDSMLVKFLQLGNDLKIFADAAYPNPLTGKNNFHAVIPYRISAAGNVEMTVFDQLGRSVSSSSEVASHPGSYQFFIDGKDLKAGCYTYILQEISGSSTGVRGRFIIIK